MTKVSDNVKNAQSSKLCNLNLALSDVHCLVFREVGDRLKIFHSLRKLWQTLAEPVKV